MHASGLPHDLGTKGGPPARRLPARPPPIESSIDINARHAVRLNLETTHTWLSRTWFILTRHCDCAWSADAKKASRSSTSLRLRAVWGEKKTGAPSGLTSTAPKWSMILQNPLCANPFVLGSLYLIVSIFLGCDGGPLRRCEFECSNEF